MLKEGGGECRGGRGGGRHGHGGRIGVWVVSGKFRYRMKSDGRYEFFCVTS